VGARGLAAAGQEQQQEGQEEQPGGGKKDAEEGLSVCPGGAHLLGALRRRRETELGWGLEKEGRPLPSSCILLTMTAHSQISMTIRRASELEPT
jgi:hypothetical protein